MSDLLDSLVQALQAQAARNRGFLSDAMAKALALAALDTIRHHQRGGGASTQPAQDAERQETWEPTGELRWFSEGADRPVKLQQASRCLEDGRVSWSDVPLVIAPPRA